MIRRANKNDFNDVYNILLMGRSLHESLGINQWTISFFTKDEIMAIIDSFYLNIIDDKITGVMYIANGPDKDYSLIEDGSWLNNSDDYLVIHRVSVHKDYYKKGVASTLFSFAIDYARAKGFKSVRIDTHYDNYPMRATIHKFNFKHCGTIYIDAKFKREAFELLLK